MKIQLIYYYLIIVRINVVRLLSHTTLYSIYRLKVSKVYEIKKITTVHNSPANVNIILLILILCYDNN